MEKNIKFKIEDLVNRLTERQINFTLAILKTLNNLILIQPDKDYLFRQIEDLSLNENELLTLIKIIEETIIDEQFLNFKGIDNLELLIWNEFIYRYNIQYIFLSSCLSSFLANFKLTLDTVPFLTLRITQPQNLVNHTYFTNHNIYQQNDFAISIMQNYVDSKQNYVDSNSFIPPFSYSHFPPTNNQAWVHVNQSSSFKSSTSDNLRNRFESLYLNISRNFNLASKIDFYNGCRLNHNILIQNISQLTWLDSKNEQQLSWALSYLQKLGRTVIPPMYIINEPERLYFAIAYSIIYEGFNFTPFFSEPNFQILNKKMSQAWYQKNYRDKKDDESALKYLLSKGHLRKLEKLSSGYGISNIKMLENLIESEYDNK